MTIRGYSGFQILRHALDGHVGWPRAWRDPQPREKYKVVIVGGGGHGLATAYYLAKNHGIRDIAVLEKGYIGGGNTGRNTTIIRSNYLLPGNTLFYEHALKLWEGLSRDLNFNVMFSARGIVNVCHSDAQMDEAAFRGNTMRRNGIDAELLDRDQLQAMVPLIDYSPQARFPVHGALVQRRAGTARHDAVAWGYARGADARGVDIVQNCAVTGIVRDGGRVTGVETTRGTIRARKVAVVAAGHTSVIMDMAGVRMPIESVCLQALVSEPIKPVLDVVVMANTVHGYISQSDKGELVIGGGSDPYNNYSQRGSFPAIEHTVTALVETFPIISRLRMMRHWGGIVDMTGDRSPIISKTDVDGLFVNCGWGTGGFKSIPGSGFVFADTIANDRPHPFAAPFGLNRFIEGRLIDESVAAAVAH